MGARLVLDETQCQVEPQPVPAVAVVGNTHVVAFPDAILVIRNFGKNFPNLEMTFKGVRRKISRAYREE
jgi:hypothetical protein